MKISDKELIRRGEQELIDAITADLDWGVIEDLFMKEHKLPLDDDVRYRRGDLIIHGDQIVYRLDFDVTVTVSLLLDRAGNCISLRAEEDPARAGQGKEMPGTGLEPTPRNPLPSPGSSKAAQDTDPGTSPSPEAAIEDRIFETASRAAGRLAEL